MIVLKKYFLMKKIILTFILLVSVILPVYAEDTTISDIKVQGLKAS